MVAAQIIVIRLFARFMIFVGGARRRLRKRGRSRRRLLRRRNKTSRPWLCMSIGWGGVGKETLSGGVMIYSE